MGLGERGGALVVVAMNRGDRGAAIPADAAAGEVKLPIGANPNASIVVSVRRLRPTAVDLAPATMVGHARTTTIGHGNPRRERKNESSEEEFSTHGSCSARRVPTSQAINRDVVPTIDQLSASVSDPHRVASNRRDRVVTGPVTFGERGRKCSSLRRRQSVV